MSQAKRVLITGAGGFIGSHLCEYLNSQHYDVIGCYKSAPTLSKASRTHVFTMPNAKLDAILSDEKPDFLVHCAGGASVAKSLDNPEGDFQKSVHATESLLNSVVHHSPKTKLVFLSSAAVYGNPLKTPIDETTPTNPISPYGYNKLSTEILCEDYHRKYQLPVTILRIFSAYGPGLKKQILWDIYQKSLQESVVSLFGTGDETRDFIYIDDIVKSIEKTFDHSAFNANKINVATGNQTTIKQLAEMMLTAINSSKSIIFNKKNKPGDPKFWAVNPEQMKKMGTTIFTPLDLGIKNYANWLRSQDKHE